MNSDSVYLQYFDIKYRQPVCDREIVVLLGYGYAAPLYRIDFPISSPPFRAAVLTLASYLMRSKPHDDTLNYYAAFCMCAQKAIQNGELVDLVYASYFMLMYARLSRDSIETVFVHGLQFCRSMQALFSNRESFSVEELSWMIRLWQSVIWTLYYLHWHLYAWADADLSVAGQVTVVAGQDADRNITPSDYVTMGGTLKELTKALDSSSFALLPDSCLDKAALHRRLESLLIHMQVYFEVFLSQAGLRADYGIIRTNQTARDQLRSILEEIINLIRCIPGITTYLNDVLQNIDRYLATAYHPAEDDGFANFFALNRSDRSRPERDDIHAALIYYSAQLFLHLLDSDIDYDSIRAMTLVYCSAFALCRICFDFGRIDGRNCSIIKRSLFWAGLVLTKSKYPAST